MKEPLWDQLEVAVAHIVHEVNVGNISSERYYRGRSSGDGDYYWDEENQVICNLFRKWMDHSCNQSIQKLDDTQVYPYIPKQENMMYMILADNNEEELLIISR